MNKEIKPKFKIGDVVVAVDSYDGSEDSIRPESLFGSLDVGHPRIIKDVKPRTFYDTGEQCFEYFFTDDPLSSTLGDTLFTLEQAKKAMDKHKKVLEQAFQILEETK